MPTETNTPNDAALDQELAELLAAEEAWENEKEAVAGGRLYDHLSGGAKPKVANVAALMRNGVEPPKMVLESWLVAGELHWVFADAESAKTWMALWLSIQVMQTGGVVAYFDEELGANVIAERLLALGADPDLIEQNFAYAPFPSWQLDENDVLAHHEFLKELGPDLRLVVYDTATDALAEANLDENSGVDVTRWVKAYPEQARRLGAAQLVLDHVGHSERGRAVGSRAKKAKAKVQYGMSRRQRFDRDKRGEVQIKLAKNTRGATIPLQRTFIVGGTPFAWQDALASHRELENAQRTNDLRDQMLDIIAKLGPVTQTELFTQTVGSQKAKQNMVGELVQQQLVISERGSRNAIRYRLAESSSTHSGSRDPDRESG